MLPQLASWEKGEPLKASKNHWRLNGKRRYTIERDGVFWGINPGQSKEVIGKTGYFLVVHGLPQEGKSWRWITTDGTIRTNAGSFGKDMRCLFRSASAACDMARRLHKRLVD